MTIYVDDPMPRPGKFNNWCHMWSSLTDEGPEEAFNDLMPFAHALGLKAGWLQVTKGLDGDFPHFDLSPARRAAALRLGAQPMRLTEWIKQRPGFKEREMRWSQKP